MKTTQYGLTAVGFVIKPLSAIIEEEKQAFRAAFGDDVDLSGESVAGAYVGNQAAKLAALWELLEGLWNAGDKDSAGGVFLDRIAAFVNVEREPAKQTQITACLWGDEGTLVPKGTLAKLSTTEDVFSLAKVARITRNDLLGIKVKIIDEADVSITLGTATVAVHFEVGSTKETLRDSLAEQITEIVGDTLTVEDMGEDGLRILSGDGVTAF